MAAAISLAEALAAVLGAPCRPTAVESVPLEAALGRCLGAALVADAPWPATDRSAMDGFAVVAGQAGLAAGTALPVVGQSLAGHPFAGRLAQGQAVRIMTGAVVPDGADAVVPVEQTSGYQGATVTLQAAVRQGQHVRPRGSELQPGRQLLAAGERLGPAALGALAVLGHHRVLVHRRPLVAIVATGDEVVPVDAVPLPHQVRESNSIALAAQVRQLGGEPLRLGIAPDEPAALRAVLQRGLDRADVLLTIGGVSAGTHDLVHGELARLGVETVFHGIALKPGKPTLFGRRTGGPAATAAGGAAAAGPEAGAGPQAGATPEAGAGPQMGAGMAAEAAPAAGAGASFVFGLPGNPASCFTVFDLLVAPLLLRLLGQEPAPPTARAQLAGAAQRPNAREQAVPAALRLSADGRAEAAALAPSPSGDPFGLLGADGYALLAAGTPPQAGAAVPFVPSAGARPWSR